VYKEDEEFEELVKSIKETGILQPILVREKGEGLFECIAGERRLRACKKAGLSEVPAIIKNLSDEEVLIVALIENLQRKNLNPLEEAIAYKNLVEKFGYTQEEIAAKVGKDRTTVANLLRLLNLPQEIQQDLMEEKLTVGHAKALLSLSSKEQQLEVRNIILQKGLSVRETERLVNKLLAGEKAKKLKQPDPNLLYLSEEISKLVGTKVNIKIQNKKTYFIFEFEEPERVEDFLETLKKAFGI
jgi:ParB family chromosome partitioning protein